MISISGAVTVFIYLLVAGLIFGLLWWLVQYIGLPQPFDKLARVVLAILAVLVIIGILLSLLGGQPIFKASLQEKPKIMNVSDNQRLLDVAVFP